jgi:hypothetical protein
MRYAGQIDIFDRFAMYFRRPWYFMIIDYVRRRNILVTWLLYPKIGSKYHVYLSATNGLPIETFHHVKLGGIPCAIDSAVLFCCCLWLVC